MDVHQSHVSDHPRLPANPNPVSSPVPERSNIDRPCSSPGPGLAEDAGKGGHSPRRFPRTSWGIDGHRGESKGGIRRRTCDPGRRPSAPRVAGFTIELIEGFDPRGRSHPLRRRLRRQAGARGSGTRAKRLKSQPCRCKKDRQCMDRPTRGPGTKLWSKEGVPKRRKLPARPRI